MKTFPYLVKYLAKFVLGWEIFYIKTVEKIKIHNLCLVTFFRGSRDDVVGIATRYGLEGPGIESRWGARFSAPIQTGSEAHPASCRMGTGSFPV
jgi:hypothetical protein